MFRFVLLFLGTVDRTRAAGPYKVEAISENPGAFPRVGGGGGDHPKPGEAPGFSEARATVCYFPGHQKGQNKPKKFKIAKS